MKNAICIWTGLAGAWIAALFGGWDTAIRTLVIFMAVDFATGLLAACIGKSRKTEGGGLSSAVGWRGLVKKAATLMVVAVAYRLDITIGTDYIRNTVIIGFMANELISLAENAALLGVKLPDAVSRAIEILREREIKNGN